MMLVWLDLESTGLAPRLDRILEVAVGIATLERPFELAERRSWVARFDLQSDQYAKWIDPRVRDMHARNGLWEACSNGGLELWEVANALRELIPKVDDPRERPVLAGSSVHFDHEFLKFWMPNVAERLSHRHYDVSAVKLFCQSLGMPKLPRAEAHRAMADVEESVEHARRCAGWLGRGERDPIRELNGIIDAAAKDAFEPRAGDTAEYVDESNPQAGVRLCRADGSLVMTMTLDAWETLRGARETGNLEPR